MSFLAVHFCEVWHFQDDFLNHDSIWQPTGFIQLSFDQNSWVCVNTKTQQKYVCMRISREQIPPEEKNAKHSLTYDQNTRTVSESFWQIFSGLVRQNFWKSFFFSIWKTKNITQQLNLVGWSGTAFQLQMFWWRDDFWARVWIKKIPSVHALKLSGLKKQTNPARESTRIVSGWLYIYIFLVH